MTFDVIPVIERGDDLAGYADLHEVHLIGPGFRVALTPDEATAIGRGLLDAAEKPTACGSCGHFIDSDMCGSECRLCADTPIGRRAS